MSARLAATLGSFLLAIAGAVVAAPASADVGPPPWCGFGKHHQYLYGHRCVPDGFHLERAEDAGVEVKVVPDPPGTTPRGSCALGAKDAAPTSATSVAAAMAVLAALLRRAARPR